MRTAKRPRIGWRLLALLWVWAVLVFMVVDLFLNVDGFDDVRPRAEVYRTMRVAAHQMVGEPYREPAAIGPRPVRNALRTVPPTPAALQARSIGEALRRITEHQDAGTAAELLALRGRIPADPELLQAFAETATETVARLWTESPGLNGERADLARAALEAAGAALQLPDAGIGTWRSASATVESLAWFEPALAGRGDLRQPVERLRRQSERVLGEPPRPGPTSSKRVAALRLASLVGDAGTAALCLRDLQPRARRSREDALAEEYALLVLARSQDSGHRATLVTRVHQQLALAANAATRRRLQFLLEAAR